MHHYFYSEVSSPFEHQIRCVPDEGLDHDSGVEWLNDLYRTIDMLDLVEDRDFVTPAMTIFRFSELGLAEQFYNSLLLGLGANITLREIA